MTKIIDGKQIAKEIDEITKHEVSKFSFKPMLFGVAVTNGSIQDDASLKYLQLKQKKALELGFDCEILIYDAKLGKKAIRRQIHDLISRSDVAGIIVQLPLPFSTNDQQYILNAVPAEFDPDCLSQDSHGAFFVGRSQILPPCVEAVKIILARENVEIKGLNAVVVGYGKLVGKPVSHWLNSAGATVTVLNEFTKLPDVISNANGDLIVTGVGKPGLINKKWISEGAMIVDFGYGHDVDGVVRGDLDINNIGDLPKFVTPVPGGVGPMVISVLLHNAMILMRKRLMVT